MKEPFHSDGYFDYGFFLEHARYISSNNLEKKTKYPSFATGYFRVDGRLKPEAKLSIRNGIPASKRPTAWMQATGAVELQLQYPELYTYLRHKEETDLCMGQTADANKILEFIANIDKDIYRTFPNNSLFLSSSKGFPMKHQSVDISRECNQYLLSLRRILVSFAYFSWEHPDPLMRNLPLKCSYQIGYCQSLNFIIGMLLLVFSSANKTTFCEFNSGHEHIALEIEEQVFWMVVAIVEKIMPPETYGVELKGSILQQELFWKHIIPMHGENIGLGPFIQWLNCNNAEERSQSLSMVTNSWFMSLFVGILPVNTLLRVWDCLFFQGEKLLFKTALTILAHAQDDVIRSHDYSDAWRALKESPPCRFDEDTFIEELFSIESLRKRASLNSLYKFVYRPGVPPAELKLTKKRIQKYRENIAKKALSEIGR